MADHDEAIAALEWHLTFLRGDPLWTRGERRDLVRNTEEADAIERSIAVLRADAERTGQRRDQER